MNKLLTLSASPTMDIYTRVGSNLKVLYSCQSTIPKIRRWARVQLGFGVLGGCLCLENCFTGCWAVLRTCLTCDLSWNWLSFLLIILFLPLFLPLFSLFHLFLLLLFLWFVWCKVARPWLYLLFNWCILFSGIRILLPKSYTLLINDSVTFNRKLFGCLRVDIMYSVYIKTQYTHHVDLTEYAGSVYWNNLRYF